ncbi:hypothetical protein FCM35_KLT19108 [Carex littledalei]|uniref:Uncharacterized protein n=1 Tax=Carex littledalei TaxID=544730 RepID=A0A833VEJ3_9POAL|nr:hypothetical protein FCM35_KLT19108 [Carex littledalei]
MTDTTGADKATGGTVPFVAGSVVLSCARRFLCPSFCKLMKVDRAIASMVEQACFSFMTL